MGEDRVQGASDPKYRFATAPPPRARVHPDPAKLGANDMLRGQDLAAMRGNLASILERARAAHPDVRLLVAGMRAAPNLGTAYARRFEAVYPNLAQRFSATLVPFLLEGVAGNRALNQPDGIHPTAEGHRLVAEMLWPKLEPLLR